MEWEGGVEMEGAGREGLLGVWSGVGGRELTWVQEIQHMFRLLNMNWADTPG